MEKTEEEKVIEQVVKEHEGATVDKHDVAHKEHVHEKQHHHHYHPTDSTAHPYDRHSGTVKQAFGVAHSKGGKNELEREIKYQLQHGEPEVEEDEYPPQEETEAAPEAEGSKQ